MADETPDLFAPLPAPAPSVGTLDLPQYRARLATLAQHGLFVGTSSWKNEGWCGNVYTEQRYLTRNKWSQAKFERECLAEYAQTFRSVCVDAGSYRFPSENQVGGTAAPVNLVFESRFH